MEISLCSYTFTPNPIPTENIITIIEKQPYYGFLTGLTFGAWQSYTERTKESTRLYRVHYIIDSSAKLGMSLS
eukprot:scaffold2382_cov184-Ochromonas_danica.AAC.6